MSLSTFYVLLCVLIHVCHIKIYAHNTDACATGSFKDCSNKNAQRNSHQNVMRARTLAIDEDGDQYSLNHNSQGKSEPEILELGREQINRILQKSMHLTKNIKFLNIRTDKLKRQAADIEQNIKEEFENSKEYPRGNTVCTKEAMQFVALLREEAEKARDLTKEAKKDVHNLLYLANVTQQTHKKRDGGNGQMLHVTMETFTKTPAKALYEDLKKLMDPLRHAQQVSQKAAIQYYYADSIAYAVKADTSCRRAEQHSKNATKMLQESEEAVTLIEKMAARVKDEYTKSARLLSEIAENELKNIRQNELNADSAMMQSMRAQRAAHTHLNAYKHVVSDAERAKTAFSLVSKASKNAIHAENLGTKALETVSSGSEKLKKYLQTVTKTPKKW